MESSAWFIRHPRGRCPEIVYCDQRWHQPVSITVWSGGILVFRANRTDPHFHRKHAFRWKWLLFYPKCSMALLHLTPLNLMFSLSEKKKHFVKFVGRKWRITIASFEMCLFYTLCRINHFFFCLAYCYSEHSWIGLLTFSLWLLSGSSWNVSFRPSCRYPAHDKMQSKDNWSVGDIVICPCSA